MLVLKRDGQKEPVKLEKIQKRIKVASKGLNRVDVDAVSQKVVAGLYDCVTSKELDNLAIETAAYLSAKDPQYDTLAVRLAVSTLHKETDETFSSAIEKLYNNTDTHGNPKPLISEEVYKIVKKNSSFLNSSIVDNRDYLFDYFGFKTLERSYLLKIKKKIIERPQHMWMRVSIGIHKTDLEAAVNTYNKMSLLEMTHATPTLFNAGTPKNQMSSCFLLQVEDDSVHGIFNSLKETALISQSAGGIGISFSNVRSKGSVIYGTGGSSNGIVPFLKIFEATARGIDQGGGKRKGSFAIYLEPWHADIFEFLDLRKNNGKEEMRARDLNLALWIPDIFMKRVEADGDWTLLDPNKCHGLHDSFGDEFEQKYLKFESEGKGEKTIKARQVWEAIITSQIETGQPYILYKDAACRKSNQKNLIGNGKNLSSNLCAEILEVVGKDDISVCNLASISLKSCIEGKKEKIFNFEKLEEIARTLTANLNRVIDENYYPVEKARTTNLRDRPIGIGVQGLADAFAVMGYSWDSAEAKQLNKDIFETIYFGAVSESIVQARASGVYGTYEGSPASQGLLQFDLWNIAPSDRHDWKKVKSDLKKYGMKNSLLICCMPTASTSQILGNTESIEMTTSNLYKRSTLSGEFVVINKYLVDDLIKQNLWNDGLRQKIMAADGSIQGIEEIPAEIKALYKTVWETSQKVILNMAADRGPYICQTQSMNLYVRDANMAKMTTALFHGWKAGLKTGIYYLRQQAASDAVKITLDNKVKVKDDELLSKAIKKLEYSGYDKETMDMLKQNPKELIEIAKGVCSIADPKSCDMCSG